MPKYNKNSRNKSKNSRTNGGSFSAKQRTCRASGREFPYSCFTLHDRPGVLNQQSVTPSSTNGSYTDINPNYFGSRCAQLARLYNKWRLVRLVIRYKPYAPLGVSASVYTGDFNRQFAAYAGYVLDPTVGALEPIEVVECGGKEFNFGRETSWELAGTRQRLYTQPTVGDTLADNRFFSLGHFNAVRTTITGPADPGILWGDWEFDWDIEFSLPIDSDSEAFSAARGIKVMKDLKHSLLENTKRLASSALKTATRTLDEQKSEREDEDMENSIGVPGTLKSGSLPVDAIDLGITSVKLGSGATSASAVTQVVNNSRPFFGLL